jgi:uncharacterized membrane protein
MVSRSPSIEKNTILALRKKETKSRIFEIDFARGFAVLLMVLYHLTYDLSDIYSFFRPINPTGFVTPGYVTSMIQLGRLFWWYWLPPYSPLQIIFSSLFMFLCGISCTFSRSNYKRGIELLYVGIFMTIFLDCIDVWMGFNIHIWFGIIQSLAISIIIYSIFDHFFPSAYDSLILTCLFALLYAFNFPLWITLIIFLVGVLALVVKKMIKQKKHLHEVEERSRAINFTFLSIFIVSLVVFFIIFLATTLNWPGFVHFTFLNAYTIEKDVLTPQQFAQNFWMMLLGRVEGGDDYFSPILTSMLVFAGATIGKTIYKKRQSIFKSTGSHKWATPITWAGRHTLEIYILHQPLSILFLYFLLAPAGYTFA